jgi:hypothetical protein
MTSELFRKPYVFNALSSEYQVSSFSLLALAMHAPLGRPLESEPRQTWRGGVDGRHYFYSDYARELIEALIGAAAPNWSIDFCSTLTRPPEACPEEQTVVG